MYILILFDFKVKLVNLAALNWNEKIYSVEHFKKIKLLYLTA